MRKWEDIIKDKLEGYESTLPEGSLAEFQALREGKKSSASKKVAPWLWGMTAVALAGIAAILFLRQPSIPNDGIQIVRQPAEPMAAVMDSTGAYEQVLPEINNNHTVSVKSIRHSDPSPKESSILILAEEEMVDADTEDSINLEENRIEEKTQTTDSTVIKIIDNPNEASGSPFIPQNNEVKLVDIGVGPAAGAVVGGGLLAALIVPARQHVPPYEGLGSEGSEGSEGKNSPSGNTDGMTGPPDGLKDKPTGAQMHSSPLRLGLSARIPVANKLYVSTGLEYSCYHSIITYSYSGDKKQFVHYLGIPLRLDWVIASRNWIDVYAGGGLQTDICTGATLAGDSIAKDKPNFSLLGAGGIQLNLTKHLGIYVEPELNWRIPSKNQELDTYRSQNPLMFSVVSGIRFSL